MLVCTWAFHRLISACFCCVFLTERSSGWCLCYCPLWCGSFRCRSVTRIVCHSRKVSSSLVWFCLCCCRKPSASPTTSSWSKFPSIQPLSQKHFCCSNYIKFVYVICILVSFTIIMIICFPPQVSLNITCRKPFSVSIFSTYVWIFHI